MGVPEKWGSPIFLVPFLKTLSSRSKRFVSFGKYLGGGPNDKEGLVKQIAVLCYMRLEMGKLRPSKNLYFAVSLGGMRFWGRKMKGNEAIREALWGGQSASRIASWRKNRFLVMSLECFLNRQHDGQIDYWLCFWNAFWIFLNREHSKFQCYTRTDNAKWTPGYVFGSQKSTSSPPKNEGVSRGGARFLCVSPRAPRRGCTQIC